MRVTDAIVYHFGDGSDVIKLFREIRVIFIVCTQWYECVHTGAGVHTYIE